MSQSQGHHAWLAPMNVEPAESYTVYIESAAGGARSGHGWGYGAFDVVGPLVASSPGNRVESF